ncbi:MAG: ABC transporter ATP-binding protein [Lachnospiraceae bacterium]|nr:ABC transporter ATP-binding protein [Lachnospiraceae bacterium]
MIRMRDVKKNYKNFTLQVSLDVPRGTIIGLIGKNGAGKSTTFKALLGLIHIDGGTVSFNGNEIKTGSDKEFANIRKYFGVALSESGFSDMFDAGDVKKVLGAMFDDFDGVKFDSYCARFNIPTEKKISELSTGNRAKLKVISTMCHNAQLLILDEPTAGLDVVARDQLLGLLREYLMEDESRSILISSHISTDLEGLCDYLYLINDGSIVLKEDTDVLLSEYALLKLSEESYGKVDKTHIIQTKKEEFGYACLTNQKQYYIENYPDIVIENGKIDDLILMMTEGGE